MGPQFAVPAGQIELLQTGDPPSRYVLPTERNQPVLGGFRLATRFGVGEPRYIMHFGRCHRSLPSSA